MLTFYYLHVNYLQHYSYEVAVAVMSIFYIFHVNPFICYSCQAVAVMFMFHLFTCYIIQCSGEAVSV